MDRCLILNDNLDDCFWCLLGKCWSLLQWPTFYNPCGYLYVHIQCWLCHGNAYSRLREGVYVTKAMVGSYRDSQLSLWRSYISICWNKLSLDWQEKSHDKYILLMKIILWLGNTTTLKGHSIRKVESHCFKCVCCKRMALSMFFLQGPSSLAAMVGWPVQPRIPRLFLVFPWHRSLQTEDPMTQGEQPCRNMIGQKG
jgi:hypothetical protein